ncbi:MAG: VOC family protein [Vicinamibacterales bacterium]
MRDSGEAIAMSLDLRHVTPLLQVFDMPRALRFYRDVLGFGVVESSAFRGTDDCDWIWLRRDSIEVMLNTAYEHHARPERADPARVAAHDDTILFIGCPDVDAAFEYLKARGVALDPPKDAPYGMRQLHLHDPDGYGICLQWSLPRDASAPKDLDTSPMEG